jgi:hypothetical protein
MDSDSNHNTESVEIEETQVSKPNDIDIANQSTPSVNPVSKRKTLCSPLSSDSEITPQPLSKLHKPGTPQEQEHETLESSNDQNSVLQSVMQGVSVTLNSPEFMSQLVAAIAKPVADLVADQLQAVILKQIEPRVKELIDTNLQYAKQTISEMAKSEVSDQCDNISRQLGDLDNKIAELELATAKHQSLIEEHEQYSRRTCLKFLHVPVPQRDPIHKFDTTQAVMDICNDKLGVKISREDLSRTHFLGSPRHGKTTIIARFVRYETRQLVFSNKKQLKNSGLVITESLTKKRQTLVNALYELRKNGTIMSYWTQDGRIFAKASSSSPKLQINDKCDVEELTK